MVAGGMTMVVTAKALEGAPSAQSLASRYESMIRLAEAIRSHRDQKDLFQLIADELCHVVPFDAMAQYDHAGNKVNWHFTETYDSKGCGISNIPKEETVAWWVGRTQQAVVLQVGNGETRFRSTIESLNRVGLRSICAVPLRTAHHRLGSLVFASHLAVARRGSNRPGDGRCSRAGAIEPAS
jgi:formate hydrogenlyase transcriptional activator